MFRFVVRYLRFLSKVPGLTLIFDGLMLLWYAVFQPSLLKRIHTIERTVGDWPEVTVSIHRLGGAQFDLGPREIGHIHGNGLVDILFDGQITPDLITRGIVLPHHAFPKSHWISFYVCSDADVQTALRLLYLSYERHVEGKERRKFS